MSQTKIIAWTGALALVGFITIEFGIIGILPDVATYYGLSIDEAGYALSGFAMIVALAGPFVTAATATKNRKTIMLIGLSAFLLTGIVSFLSPSFWLLLLVRFLPAFIHPTLISIAVFAATSNAAPHQKHQMMSIVIGGVAIATITTIPLATYLAGVFHQWQLSFLVQGIVTLIALLGIWKIYPSMPVAKATSAKGQINILRKPVFLWSAIATFLMNGTMFTTYSYFADYLMQVWHITNKQVGIMLLVFGIAGIIGNLITGKLLSKNVTYTMTFFLIGLIVIGFPLLLVNKEIPIAVLYFLIALWGFFHTPCFVNGQAYMIEVAEEAPEFANSISISFGNLGISLGTFVSGLVIVKSGIAKAPWVMIVFGLATLTAMGIKAMTQRKKLL